MRFFVLSDCKKGDIHTVVDNAGVTGVKERNV